MDTAVSRRAVEIATARRLYPQSIEMGDPVPNNEPFYNDLFPFIRPGHRIQMPAGLNKVCQTINLRETVDQFPNVIGPLLFQISTNATKASRSVTSSPLTVTTWSATTSASAEPDTSPTPSWLAKVSGLPPSFETISRLYSSPTRAVLSGVYVSNLNRRLKANPAQCGVGLVRLYHSLESLCSHLVVSLNT